MLQVHDWAPADLPVAQAEAVGNSQGSIPVAILVDPSVELHALEAHAVSEGLVSEGLGCGRPSGSFAPEGDAHHRLSFYHGLGLPHQDNDHIFEATADLVRLASPVKFRISGLGRQPGQSKASKLLDAFGMWHSAHAILGPKSIKIYTNVSFRDHHLVVNQAQKAVIEVPIETDTVVSRRRTPLKFRPTAQCKSTCKMVIAGHVDGKDVEMRFVPFQISETQGFVARDCVADDWERCIQDLVWMERQSANSPIVSRASTPFPADGGASDGSDSEAH